MTIRRPKIKTLNKWVVVKSPWWRFWRRETFLVFKMPYFDWVKRQFIRHEFGWINQLKRESPPGLRWVEWYAFYNLDHKFICMSFDCEANLLMFKLQYVDQLISMAQSE